MTHSVLFRWALIIVLSLAFAFGLAAAHLPAAFMIGPMMAAILVAVGLAPLSMPQLPFSWAQGIVGCLIAHAVTVPLLIEIGHDWPVFAGGVLAVVGLSLAIGWVLTRWQVLPGSAAIWGTLPGAAPAMVIMAGDFGCDMGLVAIVQYLRVIVVSVLAAVIARLVLPTAVSGAIMLPAGLGSNDWVGIVETVVFVVVASFISNRLRIPGGPMMGVMVIGALLQDLHVLHIALPQSLLIFGYCVVGWGVGLKFRRETLCQALRALPAILASMILLVLACAGLALILLFATGLDPMTAYLATSPGGASSVAIIASDSQLNMAYIMAMQVARAWFLILVGPFLARAVAHWAGYHEVRRSEAGR